LISILSVGRRCALDAAAEIRHSALSHILRKLIEVRQLAEVNKAHGRKCVHIRPQFSSRNS
jgi:hypothetical protein